MATHTIPSARRPRTRLSWRRRLGERPGTAVVVALTLLAGASDEQSLGFLAGTGLLNLADPTLFACPIYGFGGSDQIDLLNTGETGYSFAHNVLTVTDDGNVVASLHFEGSYTKSDFALASDNHGGTLITFK